MLRLPLFFQRALPSLVVTKARNCHRVRQRRCSYRFQVPCARQKEKQIELVTWVVWVTIPVTECARDVSKGCILHEKGNIKGKEIFGLTYRKWLENTQKRPENKDQSRKLKKKKKEKEKRIPAILLGFLVESLYLFLYNTLNFIFISIIWDLI